jgi:hypothetical protein
MDTIDDRQTQFSPLESKPPARTPQGVFPDNDLLGGVVVLRHTGVAYERAAFRNALWPRYGGGQAPSRRIPAGLDSCDYRLTERLGGLVHMRLPLTGLLVLGLHG